MRGWKKIINNHSKLRVVECIAARWCTCYRFHIFFPSYSLHALILLWYLGRGGTGVRFIGWARSRRPANTPSKYPHRSLSYDFHSAWTISSSGITPSWEKDEWGDVGQAACGGARLYGVKTGWETNWAAHTHEWRSDADGNNKFIWPSVSLLIRGLRPLIDPHLFCIRIDGRWLVFLGLVLVIDDPFC